MHELSVAQSILSIVEDVALQNSIGRIAVVRLTIGKLTAIEPSSLSFAFELLSKGTVADSARLEIEAVPITGRCSDCGREFTMEYPFGTCPDCSSAHITLIAGREFAVAEIEADD